MVNYMSWEFFLHVKKDEEEMKYRLYMSISFYDIRFFGHLCRWHHIEIFVKCISLSIRCYSNGHRARFLRKCKYQTLSLNKKIFV